jgi:hypothetical protein
MQYLLSNMIIKFRIWLSFENSLSKNAYKLEITYKLQVNKYSTLVINFAISKNFLSHINLNIKQPLMS